MFIQRFDKERFFEETVLPQLATPPEYLRDSTLPVAYDAIPVLDLDDRERFEFYACTLGYFPVSRMTEVGLVTLNSSDVSPRLVGVSSFSLEDGRPFDGIVIGRERTHYVSGLRDSETRTWHQVPGCRTTSRNLFDIIRRKTHHPLYANQTVRKASTLPLQSAKI